LLNCKRFVLRVHHEGQLIGYPSLNFVPTILVCAAKSRSATLAKPTYDNSL
jgi:hypothetical protein